MKDYKRLNDNVSILITSYNRPNCLNRLLAYYDLKFCPCNIVVADSSDFHNKEKNRNIIAKYSNLNIEHISFFSGISWYEKIPKVLSLLSTSYIALVAEDDFLTWYSICEGVSFLDKEADHIFVQGESYNFIYQSFDDAVKWYYPQSYGVRGNTSNFSFFRLKRLFNNYIQSVYGVHRRKSLLKNFLLLCSIDFDNKRILYYIGEFLFNCLHAGLGKSGVMPFPAYLKELSGSSWGQKAKKNYIYFIGSIFSQDKKQIFKLLITMFEYRFYPFNLLISSYIKKNITSFFVNCIDLSRGNIVEKFAIGTSSRQLLLKQFLGEKVAEKIMLYRAKRYNKKELRRQRLEKERMEEKSLFYGNLILSNDKFFDDFNLINDLIKKSNVFCNSLSTEIPINFEVKENG